MDASPCCATVVLSYVVHPPVVRLFSGRVSVRQHASHKRQANASDSRMYHARPSQVNRAVAGVLGAEVAAEEPLMEAGLDSLGAVEVKTSIEQVSTVTVTLMNHE
eukprot:1185798-Prorocentrum_minimum.AAC.1